jgi:type VI secretion system secreted protein VgrG
LVGGTWSVVSGTTNNINVSGASTELVGGVKSISSRSYTASVRGALAETFASRRVEAGGDREEGFGAAASYGISGATNIEGSDVTVTATARIKLEAGGVTVTITPASIEVSGDFKGDVEDLDSGKVEYE